MVRTLHAFTAAALFIALSACTQKQPDAPPLTGPSTSATQVNVTVSPAILPQDGASQALVSIAAFGPSGQPLPNLQLLAQIFAGGQVGEFGRLSAHNVATDASGHATVIYTAPPPPLVVVNGGTTVAIQVTPTNSGDAANSSTQTATIRLVPPGIIIAGSALVPDFVVPTATAGDPTVFTATVTDPSNSGQVAVGYSWNFGDGATAGGQTLTHTFATAGTFIVSLTITDNLGRTNSVSKAVTVGGGTAPTVNEIVASPSSPAVGQAINFNGLSTTVEAGHSIVAYDWTFGDGTVGSGPIVQHAYQSAGEYTVTLQVTDNVGRKSALAKLVIDVGGGGSVGGGGGGIQASFAVSPPNPSGPTGTDVVVFFDGTGSTPSSGGVIVSYVWTFDSGSPSATGQTTSHTFKAGAKYSVTLIVTDSKGKTATITQILTVTGT
jgi:PKD repeat protein